MTISHTRRFDLSFLSRQITEIQAEHEERLVQLCRGIQPPRVVTVAPFALGMPQCGPYDAEKWVSDRLDLLRENREIFEDTVNYRQIAFCVNRGGHHFTNAALGCETDCDDTGVPYIVPGSRPSWTGDALHLPDPQECPLVQEMLDLTQFVLEATEGRIPVEIPHVTEPLLQAVDLFGEDCLLALAEEPELGRQCLTELTRFGERMKENSGDG